MSEAMLGTLGLVGSVTSLFILIALAAALVASLRIPWTRIVVRVAGSWIAAAGLLLLGWAVHNERAKLRSEMPLTSQQQLAIVHPACGIHWNTSSGALTVRSMSSASEAKQTHA